MTRTVGSWVKVCRVVSRWCLVWVPSYWMAEDVVVVVVAPPREEDSEMAWDTAVSVEVQ